MKKNKMRIKSLSLMILIMMILIIGQNVVYAANTTGSSLNASLRLYREKTGGGSIGYALNNSNDSAIFDIVGEQGKKYYCINATQSATWIGENNGSNYNINYGNSVTYGTSIDLTQKSAISKLSEDYNKKIANNNYGKVLWIFDNMYMDGDNIPDFLAKIGIVKAEEIDGEPINSYFYDFNNELSTTYNSIKNKSIFTKYANNSSYPGIYSLLYGNLDGYGGYQLEDGTDVLLTKELIEAVQQAAIWHFTNSDNSKYNKNYVDENCIQEGKLLIPFWLKYSTNINNISCEHWDYMGRDKDNMDLLTPSEIKNDMLQEQAAILFNYLVDGAEAANKNGEYTSSEANIEIQNVNAKIIEDGSNYKVGPFKIDATQGLSDKVIKVTTGTSTDITDDVNFVNASETKLTTDKVLEGNVEFYVVIAKSKVQDKVVVKATANVKKVNKILWISRTREEQPLVEVKREVKPTEDSKTVTLNKVFDLALRKSIVKLNNKTTGIINETGTGLEATRNINVDLSTIPDTATYKHRKDPVVVGEGDIVTYRISVYNEGEIDGYASKIVDQLATGLECNVNSGTEVTSNKGNKYTVNYDSTTNKITFTLTGTSTSLTAFKGTNLDSDYIDIDCKVVQTPATDGKTKNYLTNIAYIAEAKNKDGVVQLADRDGNESKPSEFPNKTANQLNNTVINAYKGNSNNQSIIADTNNGYYYKGEQDDDDFETVVVLPKEFDLKLMKFISKINNTASGRTLTVNTSNLNKVVNGKKVTTADYQVSKVPLAVATGDYVTYTFRIYNEGEINGYAKEISEDIPVGLKYVWDAGVLPNADGSLNFDNAINELTDADKAAMEYNANMLWGPVDGHVDENGRVTKICTNYLSKETSADNLIKAFDSSKDKGHGEGLSYKEVSVRLKVISTDSSKIIRNEAAITNDEDEKGNSVTDRDSTPEDWNKENSDDNYENNPDYPKYEEDDEDYDNIKLKEFDLALRKYISKVSTDGFKNEQNIKVYNRVPDVDTTHLKDGTANTAIYNHSKLPVSVSVGNYILYTIRVYNEGEIDGYASEVKDYLPEYLDFVNSTDKKINDINSKWTYDPATRTVKTNQLNDEVLKAFDSKNDDNKGSGLSHADVQIICRVNNKATSANKITNIAEISEYRDKNNNEITHDRDSDSDSLTDNDKQKDNLPEEKDRPTYKDNEINKEYVPGQEDDDDFEKVIVKTVDLALTKFITAVSKENKLDYDGEYLTPNKKIGTKTNEYTRATVADTKGLKAGTSTNATYTAKKNIEPLEVQKNDYILYNIRVYNEGEVDAYAGEITDYLPENLEFVPGGFNTKYGWKAEGQVVKTSYLSSKNGTDKMLKAFDKVNDDGKGSGLDYKDLPILCKVSDKAENGKKMVNTAEITKYEDENGNDLPKDIDSTPENKKDKNVENRSEDDDDYEVIVVKEFDLALLKYVTEVIVKEDGTTTTTKTGNTGSPKDIIPKVEIHRKKIKSTVVKFKYTIKITNEGDIAGYAKEITDYVPTGLKFYKEDNTGWKDEGNNVISTELLKDKLLQPGESATVTVVLRWINGANNLQLKTNIAEISKDYNDKGIPDRDSTPDNKKTGEDDIDDASVLLSIKTGVFENTIMYVSGALIILVVLGVGIVLIKKYVL